MNRLQEGQIFSCYRCYETRYKIIAYQLLKTLSIPRGDYYRRVFDDLCAQRCSLVAVLIKVTLKDTNSQTFGLGYLLLKTENISRFTAL